MNAAEKKNPAAEKEATNFHVVPKERAKEQAKTPEKDSDAAQSDLITRDPEAGALGADSNVNQPLRDSGYDRSQVS